MDEWSNRERFVMERYGFASGQAERRSDPRYSVDEDSAVLFVGYGEPMPVRLIELSQEGCRLRAAERVSARARLPAEVFFRVNGMSFRFCGVVQWNDGRSLVGIHFVNMIPRRAVELANVICGMEKNAEVRAEAVNLLLAEQQAQQPAGRYAAQQAADRSIAPDAVAGMKPAGAAHPDEADVFAEAGAQFVKTLSSRERRSQIRHNVDTHATILLVKIGSTLRGRILDLSLSGCRIRTEERFPVGIYTRVETEFRLEGLPFRLGGVIQVIHDHKTVGIRFLDLSERKREQVTELIGEIEQMRAPQAEPAAAESRV